MLINMKKRYTIYQKKLAIEKIRDILYINLVTLAGQGF